MVLSLLPLLSDDLQILFLSLWLDVRSLTTLDVAVSSHRWRPRWLMVLRHFEINQLSRRGIRASRLEMKTRVRGCNIMLVDTSDLVLIGLHRHNRSVHSGCDQPLSQAEEHQYIRLL